VKSHCIGLAANFVGLDAERYGRVPPELRLKREQGPNATRWRRLCAALQL
jgi:hypothetical protein